MAVRKRGKRQRGVVLIMLTVSLAAVVPMAGLAFDVGLLYLVRTKLSAAVDAAVMAGARSLNRGMDLASQVQSATDTAVRYFDANFPDGLYGTSGRTFTPTVAEGGYRTRTVSGVASVTAPLYFLRLLGQDTATMSARATASRRDVNLILVVDRSYSIELAGATTAVKNSAIAFVNRFSEGRDRVGLVSFGGTYRVDFPPAMNFKTANPSITTRIGNLQMNGYTNMAAGLLQAYELLQAINEPGALNVIVFFTDGRPSALTVNNLPVKTLADTRYGDGSSSYPSTSTTYSMPASSCSSASPKSGALYAYVGSTWPPTVTNNTYGVMRPDSTSPSMDEWTLTPLSNNTNCGYAAASGSSGRMRVRRDIAYLPDNDGANPPNSLWGYLPFSAPNELYPAGHPYAGRIRIDTPRALRYAAYNLTDNIAQRVRNDAWLRPVIFSIGLGCEQGGSGCSGAEPIDHVLLRRLANDRDSPIFNPAIPAGLYVYSPTPAQLDQAFLRVASEVLRLAE